MRLSSFNNNSFLFFTFSVPMATWCVQHALTTCWQIHVSRMNQPPVQTAVVRSARTTASATWLWKKLLQSCQLTVIFVVCASHVISSATTRGTYAQKGKCTAGWVNPLFHFTWPGLSTFYGLTQWIFCRSNSWMRFGVHFFLLPLSPSPQSMPSMQLRCKHAQSSQAGLASMRALERVSGIRYYL